MRRKISQELAEETGTHIGDGSMNIYNRAYAYTIAGSIKDDKEYMTEIVAPLIKKIWSVEPKLGMWSKGSFGFRVFSKEMVKFKHEVLGLPLGRKLNVEMPQVIFQDVNLSFACLRGIFDTDGSVYIENKYGKPYPRLEIVTTSRKLPVQIKKILESARIDCSISKVVYRDKEWRPKFTIRVNGFRNLKKWMNKVGTNNPKNRNKINTLYRQTL